QPYRWPQTRSPASFCGASCAHASSCAYVVCTTRPGKLATLRVVYGDYPHAADLWLPPTKVPRTGRDLECQQAHLFRFFTTNPCVSTLSCYNSRRKPPATS